MTSSKLSRNVPAWMLMVVVGIGGVLLGFWGWKTLAGGEPSAGPPKAVHPGMYDLRAEAAKMNAAKQAGSAQNGQ
jgi:hypothetical protein